MKNIGDYLERFKNIQVPDNFIKKELIKIIKNKYNFDLSLKDIKIDKSLTVYLNAPSVVKMEVQLEKQEIINELKKLTGKKIKDII